MKTIRLDNFKPLPLEAVKALFDLAEVKKGEKHIDLGSGDGRMVLEGLKRGADSIGYEKDCELVKKSIEEHKINVICKDIFEVDVSDADLITCWFSKKLATYILADKLHKEMKKGARFVIAETKIPNWKITKETEIIFFDRWWWKFGIFLYIKE